mgnify:FL=1|tara:strand:+ start:55 stop:315 length:261 start_codon:yes stop_codon:yes gene_type:complete
MKKELATYILKLNEAAKTTKRAEDRSLYEKYLSSAAVILALVESGAEKEAIKNEVQSHERLWGNTWLVDDVYTSPSSAWQKVKEVM